MQGSADKKLVFHKKKNDEIVAYADADWGGCKLDRKSFTGFIFKLSDGPIVWESQYETQPLDVAFFPLLKRHGRKVLTDWKSKEGCRETCVPKSEFSKLLTKLLEMLQVF